VTRSVIGRDNDYNRRFGDTPVNIIASLSTTAMLHRKPPFSKDIGHFDICEIRCVKLQSTNGHLHSGQTNNYSALQLPCIATRHLEHPVLNPVMNSPRISVEIRCSLLLLTVTRVK